MAKIFPHRRRRFRPQAPVSRPSGEDEAARRERALRERAAIREQDRVRAERRMAAREQKAQQEQAIAHANALAETAFPWSLIRPSIRIFDRIMRSTADAPMARYGALLRGRVFAIHHIFGAASYSAASGFMPQALVDQDSWDMACALCPVTLDRGHIAKITAFFEAWTDLMFRAPDRAEFRRVIEEAAMLAQREFAALVEAARERRDGLSLRTIGDGWFVIREDRTARMIWNHLGRPCGTYEAATAMAALRRRASPPAGTPRLR